MTPYPATSYNSATRATITRFGVLATFCTLTGVNGFSWLMFSPAEDALSAEYRPNMTPAQIDLLSSWQPIVYMLTAPLCATLLVRPNGLRTAIRVGCFVEVIGAAVKLLSCIAPHSFASLIALHIGQIMSACVSPIAIGSPSHLAALWFEPKERARATGAGVLFNNVGNALGYFIIPTMAQRHGYLSVILFEFVFALLVGLMCIAMVPEDPRHHRALTIDGAKVDAWQETKGFFLLPPCIILSLAYMWSSGGYVAWTSMFDDLLTGRYSDEFIGLLGGGSTVAYVIGGMVSSSLADSVLRGQLKGITVTCSIFGSIFCILTTVSLPVVGKLSPPIDLGPAWLFIVVSLSGAFNGATAPIFYELAAEMAFPVSEGVSGNILSYFENGGALLLFQVVSRSAKGPTMNIVYTIGMVLTCIGLIAMPVVYRRAMADDDEATSGGLSPGRPSGFGGGGTSNDDGEDALDDNLLTREEAEILRRAVLPSNGAAMGGGSTTATIVYRAQSEGSPSAAAASTTRRMADTNDDPYAVNAERGSGGYVPPNATAIASTPGTTTGVDYSRM